MRRTIGLLFAALSLAVPAVALVTATPAFASGTAPTFSADSPPTTATVGTAYSYTFVASGSPTPTFAVASGTLPTGLGLDSATGVLSGTPTAGGSFTFTVQASNGVSPDAVTSSITIGVQSGPVFTADSPPSPAASGVVYSYTFAASGNPAPTYALYSGTLPPGLTLNSTTGTLSGTPSSYGTYTFTIEATNAVSTVLAPLLTISVQAPSGPAFVADSPPTQVTYDQTFSYTFVASGVPKPVFAVASGTLPTGLALNSQTGLLSGTLLSTGSFSFTISATNGYSSAALSPVITIVVAVPSPPVFTAFAPSSPANVGSFYSYTFAATASPAAYFTLGSGALPPGLTLNPTTGVLSGVPSTAGSFQFTIDAINASGVAVTPLLTVVAQQLVPPVLTKESPPAKATVGARYAGYVFAASGLPAPTFKVASGSLPPGLSLDATTGLLAGTPRAAGTFRFTIAASNGVGAVAVSPTLELTVAALPVLTVRAHNVRVEGPFAVLPVECAKADCRGTIRLRHQGTVLGTRAYKLSMGQTTVVQVRLNAAAASMLAHAPRRHLPAVATVVVVGTRSYLKALLLLG